MGRSAKSVEWFSGGRWRAYPQVGSLSSCPLSALVFCRIAETLMHVAGEHENQSWSSHC